MEDHSSEDEGLMDFVMKKDISRGQAQPQIRSAHPMFSKFGGRPGLAGKSLGGKPVMMGGKTLSISKNHQAKMKSLNLSSLNKQKMGMLYSIYGI